MNYLVLIKQVPNPDKKVGMKEDGTVDREKSEPIMNPYDANALEVALQLKDKYGGKIMVVSMGPPRAEDTIREALAMGADDGVLLCDRAMAGADTYATANSIANAIKKIGDYSMVLCGMQAVDGDTAQVGPQVAERLGIPQVTYVEEISIEPDGTAKLRRIIEGGHETYRTRNPVEKSPILVTVTSTANRPRLPSLMKQMKAKKAVIAKWGICDIEPCEENQSRHGMKGSPTRVKKIERMTSNKAPCKMAEGGNVDEMVDSLVKVIEDDKINIIFA